MSLAFAGFPTKTYAKLSTRAHVTATIRAECDRRRRCHKDQRWLADKAGLPLPTFNYHVRKLREAGVIAMVYRGRRKSAVIVFLPEHCWVTPEKPAPQAAECSTFLNTTSKAREKKKDPPVTPRDAGGAAEGVDQSGGREGAGSEGAALVAAPNPPASDDPPAAPPHSRRRTPYGQPRQPRRPRGRRQREIKRSLAQAFLDVLNSETAPAGPALPAPPDIIPPGHELVAGEVIPMPRQPLHRPRGYSPATGLWEAMKYVLGTAETPNRAGGADPARPLLAAGRGSGSPADDRSRVA